MKQRMIGLGLFLLAAMVVADFVQTPVYFTRPSTTSFTVFTLSGSQTSVTGGTYPLTENYYFNTSSGYDTLVKVCRTGDTSDCMTELSSKPAFRFRNTGNSNIRINMMFNASLPSGVLVCSNTTKAANCGTDTISLCSLTGSGNVNSSTWFFAGNISSNTPCFDLNASLYANFTDMAAGTTVVGLTHNSTTT